MTEFETRIGPFIVSWSRLTMKRLLYYSAPALVMFGILYGYGDVAYHWSLAGAVSFMVAQRVFNP